MHRGECVQTWGHCVQMQSDAYVGHKHGVNKCDCLAKKETHVGREESILEGLRPI